MLFNTTTPAFRYLLHIIFESVKAHQIIGMYYDVNIFTHEKSKETFTLLKKDFSIYYNILLFHNYVPGFLTNNLLINPPKFTFLIFLNFDYKNYKHRSLLNEIITSKIEYIILSPYNMDLVAYNPFFYLNIDLNNLSVLHIFRFYLKNFLNLKINHPKYLMYKPDDIHKRHLYVFNLFYALIVLHNKDEFKTILAFFLAKKKYTVIPFHLLKLKKNLLKVLLYPTETKKDFFEKFGSEFALKYLYKYKKFIARTLIKNLSLVVKNLRKFFKFKDLNKYFLYYKSVLEKTKTVKNKIKKTKNA